MLSLTISEGVFHDYLQARDTINALNAANVAVHTIFIDVEPAHWGSNKNSSQSFIRTMGQTLGVSKLKVL